MSSSRRRELLPASGKGAARTSATTDSEKEKDAETNRVALCRFFERTGECKNGNACPFKHAVKANTSSASNVVRSSSAPHSAASPAAEMCRYFQRNGTCKSGDRCRFIHSTTAAPTAATATAPATGVRTQLCKFFKRDGSCRDGDACAYSHAVSAARAKSAPPATNRQVRDSTTVGLGAEAAAQGNGAKSARVCKFYRRDGTCRDGNDCPFLHERTPVAKTASSTASEPGVGGSEITSNKRAHQPQDQSQQQQQPQRAKLCRYFKRGDCKLGEECPFSHARSSTLTSKPQSLKAKDDASSELSGDKKQAECRHFKRLGTCRLGDSCNFLHSTSTAAAGQTQKQKNQSQVPAAGNSSALQSANKAEVRKDELCRYYKKNGSCRLGSECPYRHVKGNTVVVPSPSGPVVMSQEPQESVEVCRFFQRTGTCRHGSQCRYSHSTAGGESAASVGSPTSPFQPASAAEGSTAKPCRYFSRGGHCKNGAACPFSHTTASVGAAERVRKPRERRGARATNKAKLLDYLKRYLVLNGTSLGDGATSSVSRPFLENILRNNSHKPGFVLEHYLCVVEADRLRILDEYRVPLGLSSVQLLQTTVPSPAARADYASMDPSFDCCFENGELSLSYSDSQAQASGSVANGNAHQYRGALPVDASVSVPVDDLCATAALLHDYLFGYVLGHY